MTELEAKKALLTYPGDTIQETIDEIRMNQNELAERLGRSVPKVNELIKGKAQITKDLATKLEYVLGISSSFWLNLERQYQDELLEIERLENLEKCTAWAAKFPLKFLKNVKVLPNTNDKKVLSEHLLKFFRVGSPIEWAAIYIASSIAFKIELRHTSEPEAISVWLRLGELQADNVQAASFDKKKVREKIKDFNDLSYEQPADWMNKLQELCLECGIVLVYTPSIAKAPIFGATRWIKDKTVPLIQMTDRMKDYNQFWFTFYHELGHILLHGKKDIFIDGLEEIEPNEEKEKEADTFAVSKLFPRKEMNIFLERRHFKKESILSYSKETRIHVSILVSQAQRTYNDLYMRKYLSNLKEKVNIPSLDLSFEQ